MYDTKWKTHGPLHDYTDWPPFQKFQLKPQFWVNCPLIRPNFKHLDAGHFYVIAEGAQLLSGSFFLGWFRLKFPSACHQLMLLGAVTLYVFQGENWVIRSPIGLLVLHILLVLVRPKKKYLNDWSGTVIKLRQSIWERSLKIKLSEENRKTIRFDNLQLLSERETAVLRKTLVRSRKT